MVWLCAGVRCGLLLCAAILALPSASAAPVKLAVFTFELDDFSPAIATGAEDAADIARLSSVTEDVRKALAESGKYALIGVEGTDAPAAKSRTLRDCNGCEAALAL